MKSGDKADKAITLDTLKAKYRALYERLFVIGSLIRNGKLVCAVVQHKPTGQSRLMLGRLDAKGHARPCAMVWAIEEDELEKYEFVANVTADYIDPQHYN